MLRPKLLARAVNMEGCNVERKTTYGHVYNKGLDPDDPKPPDTRHDWILESAAVDNGVIFWFWARWEEPSDD